MDEPVEPNTLLKSPLPAILALSDSDTSSEDDDSTDSSVCESVAAPLPPIEALDDGLQHSQRDEDVGPSLPPLQQQVLVSVSVACVCALECQLRSVTVTLM